jgi:hypothetical protein
MINPGTTCSLKEKKNPPDKNWDWQREAVNLQIRSPMNQQMKHKNKKKKEEWMKLRRGWAQRSTANPRPHLSANDSLRRCSMITKPSNWREH